MLRRILILCMVLSLAVFACAGPALGDDGPNDPCKGHHGKWKKRKHGEDDSENPCVNIPEAPLSLLYPAVGGALVVTFLVVGGRRRRVVVSRPA